MTLSCVMKRMSRRNMLEVTNSVSCYIVPHQSMSLTADISAAPALTDQALANCLEAKDRRHIAWMPVLPELSWKS